MSLAKLRAFRDPNVLPTDCQFHAGLNSAWASGHRPPTAWGACAVAPGQAITDPPLRGGLARWRLGKRSQTPHCVGGLRDGAWASSQRPPTT